MAIKDYNSCLFITDATTGDVITTIKTRLFYTDTVLTMINNIIEDDLFGNKHGILIKHGIEP